MKFKELIKKNIWLLLIIIGALLISFSIMFLRSSVQTIKKPWTFESIDTMKYSRDLSREKLNDKEFENVIDQQIKDIASTGATHVAIATPYDEEFFPILKKWVDSARKYKLNVWFRGNFSGWEGWFDYGKITQEEHIKLTDEFILKHKEIFQDGDVFSACPECENGGGGDPRAVGRVEEYRKFLVNEYLVTKNAFNKINKKVASNYYSMNLDVAKLVMDHPTTKALDGLVTIDHYVKTPEELNSDINDIAKKSGGKVVLGEFGAPIPDINGNLSEAEQAVWIEKALFLLKNNKNLIGVNYWVNVGGSTQLWTENNIEKQAVSVIRSTYSGSISSK